MRLMFATTVLPHKKRIGSEVASQSIIDGLQAAGAAVDVVGYSRANEDAALVSGSVSVGPRYIETRGAKLHSLIWLLASFAKRAPYSATKYYSKAYVQHVRRLISEREYECVVIDHPQIGWLAPHLPQKLPRVFVAHNIEHQMYAQQASVHQHALGRWLYGREAALIGRGERALATSASEIWTLSAHDAAHFRALAPRAKVRELAVPPTSLPRSDRPVRKQFDIGLIGSWSWQANREALSWFLAEVYPRLSDQVSVQVAGAGADWLVSRYDRVKYVGFVPDAIAFMQAARVIAIPTLSGGGIQIKTLDAIASGSAVVATKCALRGIDSAPCTVSVADGASRFAQELGAAIEVRADVAERCASAIAWAAGRKRRFVHEMLDVTAALKSYGSAAV
jgi:hypothetical protein